MTEKFLVAVANASGNIINAQLKTHYTNLSDYAFYDLMSASIDFNMDNNGVFSYTGENTITAYVSAKLSLATTNYGVNVYICLYKNNVKIGDTESFDQTYPEIINFPIELSQNDYLEIFAKSTDETGTEISQIQFSIFNTSI